MVFCFQQRTAYEVSACLVGSDMCIRDKLCFGPLRIRSSFSYAGVYGYPRKLGLFRRLFLDQVDLFEFRRPWDPS